MKRNATMYRWGAAFIVLAIVQVVHIGSASAFSPGVMELGNRYQGTTYICATSSKGAADEAERLKEQARKLREEIESFQKAKDSMAAEERRKIQAELDEKQEFIDRYSAVVPILKPDGSTVEENVQFSPQIDGNASSILVLEAPLPLGVLLGEHDSIVGMTTVDEVAKGSNGESADFKEGDLIRGCTACRMEMEQPTWQLLAGGIGRPKTMRFMFSADYQPFEQVMEALASNRLDPEGRTVVVVVERPEPL